MRYAPIRRSVAALALASVLAGAPPAANASWFSNMFKKKQTTPTYKKYKSPKVKSFSWTEDPQKVDGHVKEYSKQLSKLKKDLKKNGSKYSPNDLQKLNNDIAKLTGKVEKQKSYRNDLQVLLQERAAAAAQRDALVADQSGTSTDSEVTTDQDQATIDSGTATDVNVSYNVLKKGRQSVFAKSSGSLKVESAVRGPASVAPSSSSDAAR